MGTVATHWWLEVDNPEEKDFVSLYNIDLTDQYRCLQAMV